MDGPHVLLPEGPLGLLDYYISIAVHGRLVVKLQALLFTNRLRLVGNFDMATALSSLVLTLVERLAIADTILIPLCFMPSLEVLTNGSI